MSENANQSRGGKAFQSVLMPHFDFIHDHRQRRKTWQEITELVFAEKGIRVSLHTVYYFYKRRLKRLGRPHWEDAAISAPRSRLANASTPSQKTILDAMPPQREFRQPKAQHIKLNDPTKV